MTRSAAAIRSRLMELSDISVVAFSRRMPIRHARPDRFLSGRAALTDAGVDGGARADHNSFSFSAG